jgi:hypothetical protein
MRGTYHALTRRSRNQIRAQFQKLEHVAKWPNASEYWPPSTSRKISCHERAEFKCGGTKSSFCDSSVRTRYILVVQSGIVTPRVALLMPAETRAEGISAASPSSVHIAPKHAKTAAESRKRIQMANGMARTSRPSRGPTACSETALVGWRRSQPGPHKLIANPDARDGVPRPRCARTRLREIRRRRATLPSIRK